jgi:hypothetical protein
MHRQGRTAQDRGSRRETSLIYRISLAPSGPIQLPLGWIGVRCRKHAHSLRGAAQDQTAVGRPWDITPSATRRMTLPSQANSRANAGPPQITQDMGVSRRSREGMISQDQLQIDPTWILRVRFRRLRCFCDPEPVTATPGVGSRSGHNATEQALRTCTRSGAFDHPEHNIRRSPRSHNVNRCLIRHEQSVETSSPRPGRPYTSMGEIFSSRYSSIRSGRWLTL